MSALVYSEEDIKNGMILPDSEKGIELGLTSNRFLDGSYLWLKDNTLYISMVMSRAWHKGYVLNILNKGKERGYRMEAAPASARMEYILKKFGFVMREDGIMVWLPKYDK